MAALSSQSWGYEGCIQPPLHPRALKPAAHCHCCIWGSTEEWLASWDSARDLPKHRHVPVIDSVPGRLLLQWCGAQGASCGCFLTHESTGCVWESACITDDQPWRGHLGTELLISGVLGSLQEEGTVTPPLYLTAL